MRKIIIIAIIVVIALVVFFGRSLYTGMVNPPNAPAHDICNSYFLWKHVWNSSRLTIIDKCTSVTGTILSSYQVNDGDQHIQLVPDAPYLKLLNKKNIEFQFGALVVEPICSHDPTIINNSTMLDAGVGLAENAIGQALDEDAIDACKGFVNKVYIPKAGERVRVTGSYVLDTWHGWMEIHPVSKIEVIK